MMIKNNSLYTKIVNVVAALLLVAVLLTACAPGEQTREGRINRIEAFLVDRHNGYEDIKPPNIYNLSDAERMSIINGLSFVVVSGKEAILIDYLNGQWPEWRSADGFMVNHLDYLIKAVEKSVARKVLQDLEIDFAVDFTNLAELYNQTVTILQEQVDAQQLHVVRDSFSCSWWNTEAGLYLQNAQFNLIDLNADEFYSVVYSGSTLAIKRLKVRGEVYGHPSLAAVVRSVDERQIQPLLETVQGDVLSVSLSLQNNRLDGDLSALKEVVNYRQAQPQRSAEQIGRLTINRQQGDLVDALSYALYLPASDD